MKKVLTEPISKEDLASIRIGDVIYYTGHIVTCRDVGHRRLIEEGIPLPISVRDSAIFHAGPIVRKCADGAYEMVSIGPTTSMRMEKFERQFIAETGVRLIVGKGAMGAGTSAGCRDYQALHCVFPAGCAVLAANAVEEIEGVEWTDLGMPESLWVCRVKELGSLIESVDSRGGNLFEENKVLFNQRKQAACEALCKKVNFIR